eukprot:9031012-Alexandrium_andersonii.AAC.1
MSASLVGSEMCIRDSIWAWLKAGGTVAAWTAAAAILRASDHFFEQPPRPVSYTHLTLPTICSV